MREDAENISDRHQQCVLQVHRDRSAEVFALRAQEYGRTDDFQMFNSDCLKWDKHDDGGVVLAVQSDKGRLVSTMRCVLMNGFESSGRLLDPPGGYAGRRTGSNSENEAMTYASDPALIRVSVMFLGRAATDAEIRVGGLNTLLRRHFIEFASEWCVDYIVGEVNESTGRMHLMQKMGYEFHDAPEHSEKDGVHFYSEKDGGHFSSGHRWMVAVLDMKKCYHTARQLLQERTGQQWNLFPWYGEKPVKEKMIIY